MLDKTKNIVVTITFILVLVLFFIINICKKDTDISITERRKLAIFPAISIVLEHLEPRPIGLEL